MENFGESSWKERPLKDTKKFRKSKNGSGERKRIVKCQNVVYGVKSDPFIFGEHVCSSQAEIFY